jgi:hypothetical protein
MTQTVPDFTTAIITILFLLVLAAIAFFIRLKSGSLKKIIKKDSNLDILNQLSLKNGYLAYVFKVGNENFFFVGHKSGRGSLTQITQNISSEILSSNHIDNNKQDLKPREVYEKKVSENKPLQHVNISDLLTAHKKGGSNA